MRIILGINFLSLKFNFNSLHLKQVLCRESNKAISKFPLKEKLLHLNQLTTQEKVKIIIKIMKDIKKYHK